MNGWPDEKSNSWLFLSSYASMVIKSIESRLNKFTLNFHPLWPLRLDVNEMVMHCDQKGKLFTFCHADEWMDVIKTIWNAKVFTFSPKPWWMCMTKCNGHDMLTRMKRTWNSRVNFRVWKFHLVTVLVNWIEHLQEYFFKLFQQTNCTTCQ